MGFLNELVSNFTHKDQDGQQQHGNAQSSHQSPPVSPPWYAEWDAREDRWLFVNQQNGERTFQYPGPGYAQQQGSYGTPQGGYGYDQGGYNNQGAYNQNAYNPTNTYHQEEQKQGGNGWKYAAAGAAGLAGGALLMHESEDIKDGWNSAENRVERNFDEFGNDISNLPENTARWTGEAVGNVENFGDRVEDGWDSAVDNVEEFPEDAARWTGEKVQAVEDIPDDIENKWDGAVDNVEEFGDRMDNAYEEGRDEERYDDDY